MQFFVFTGAVLLDIALSLAVMAVSAVVTVGAFSDSVIRLPGSPRVPVVDQAVRVKAAQR